MKVLQRVVLVVCLAVVLSACAVGNRHRYHDTLADISVTGAIAIAVTAQDQRNYVVTGNKSPDFVGLQRGGFGIPFDVSTDSGNALSHDMAQSLANSLSKKGFRAMPITVGPGDDRQAVIDKLKATGTEKFLLLTLTEWKSDTYTNTALVYDIKATILDRYGKVLSESALKGRDDLGGSAWNPPAHAKEAVPAAFKEKIEKLLNSKEIIAALNS
jgi:hypothetical protein